MPTLTSNPTPAIPSKVRKPRKKSPYVLQQFDNDESDGWRDFDQTKQFPDDAAARKFVRDGQHVGRFRVIRLVSEFTSAIEERKVVKLT